MYVAALYFVLCNFLTFVLEWRLGVVGDRGVALACESKDPSSSATLISNIAFPNTATHESSGSGPIFGCLLKLISAIVGYTVMGATTVVTVLTFHPDGPAIDETAKSTTTTFAATRELQVRGLRVGGGRTHIDLSVVTCDAN